MTKQADLIEDAHLPPDVEYVQRRATLDAERIRLREEIKNSHRNQLKGFDSETRKLFASIKEEYRKKVAKQLQEKGADK